MCDGFWDTVLYLSKASSHNLVVIWVNLATFLRYTNTETTNRLHYLMLYKGIKRQQICHCAKPNVNQSIYYWGNSSLFVWWAEDLNLIGRGRGRCASEHAPTLADLINIWLSIKLFLLNVHVMMMSIAGSCYLIWESLSQFGKPCSKPRWERVLQILKVRTVHFFGFIPVP